MIREDQSFSQSYLHRLDKLLARKHEEIVNVFGSIIGGQNVNVSQSFIALAAPSMEGKTQSAFVMNLVKPLYFPISETVGSDSIIPQPIYGNFKKLVFQLENCAVKDLLDKDLTEVSASKLMDKFVEKDLLTLGFLVKLVDETVRKPADMNWMLFHATRPNFKFTTCKISQVRTDFFKDFCLFLDEFSAERWAVFVRNLAHAVGLNCVVANTNTKIANVIGRESASGGEGQYVWSVVITKLDPPTLNFMNLVHGLNESIRIITLNRQESDPICKFLQDFTVNQLKHLRPGVAAFAAKALKSFASKLDHPVNFSFGYFMDFIIKSLKYDIVFRKPTISDSEKASLAKIGLSMALSYGNRAGAIRTGIVISNHSSKLLNRKEFLENHLYYLTNPQEEGFWMFLTFIPSERAQPLKVYSGSNWLPWVHEYTYFNSDELLTILACLCIPVVSNVSILLNAAQITQESQAESVSNAPNSNALTNPGNSFEVTSAVCILDSSQHSFSQVNFDVVFSFKGQTGEQFVKNIVYNTIFQTRNLLVSVNVNIPVTNNDFDLNGFLSNCSIPFLYSLDYEHTVIEQFSSFNSDFYLRPYVRTSNGAQIDGKFPFLFNGVESLAICECKNWMPNIGSNILLEILEKAFIHENSKLSLVFCTQFVNYSPETSAFKDFCYEMDVNVYRVRMLNMSSSFSIVPFDTRFKISSNPRIVCIIFETHQINEIIT